MNALNYEYLIRSAFQCGRYGVPGANADTYRSLERSFIRSRDNNDPLMADQLLFEYAYDCGEVATFIITAIEKFAKDFEEKLDADENQEIEDIITLLHRATMNDIDSAIARGEILMIKYGRFPQ